MPDNPSQCAECGRTYNPEPQDDPGVCCICNRDRTHSMVTCPTHHRWTRIERADGTVAKRRCPECPRPRGAAVVNQFTREIVGRMPPELIEARDV